MHAKPAAGTVPKNLTTKPFKAVKKTKKLSKAMASTSLHPIMIDTPSSPWHQLGEVLTILPK